MVQFNRLAVHLAAVLFAALAPTVALVVLDQSIELGPIVFFIALGHVVVFGLPLYLIFRSKGWFSLISAVGVGFVVGALPLGILTWPLQSKVGVNASSNGVPTIVDGVPTIAGWIEYTEFLLYLGAFGALAGLVFWLVLKIACSVPATGTAIEPPPNQNYDWTRNGRFGIGFAAVALLLTGAVAAIPSITKDRTCHNMFRDGRTSIGPQVGIDLQIAIDDWPKLTKVFERFGSKHGLSFQDTGKYQPEVVSVLALSLCSEAGINIEAMDQRWKHQDYRPILPGRGVSIGIYQVQKDSDWKSLAQDFIVDLESSWPGKVQFRDGGGQAIPMPKELQKMGLDGE